MNHWRPAHLSEQGFIFKQFILVHGRRHSGDRLWNDSHTWAACVSDSLAFLPHGVNLCQISLWLHSLWQITQIRHLSLDGAPARTQSVMGGRGVVDIGGSSSPTNQLTKVELWEAGLWPSLCGQVVLPSLKQVDLPLIFKIGPEMKCKVRGIHSLSITC